MHRPWEQASSQTNKSSGGPQSSNTNFGQMLANQSQFSGQQHGYTSSGTQSFGDSMQRSSFGGQPQRTSSSSMQLFQVGAPPSSTSLSDQQSSPTDSLTSMMMQNRSQIPQQQFMYQQQQQQQHQRPPYASVVGQSTQSSSSNTPPMSSTTTATPPSSSNTPPMSSSSTTSSQYHRRGIETDPYTFIGLLEIIHAQDKDHGILSLGYDLTTLGLNLNSPESLYSQFASPWSDHQNVVKPEYTVPKEYLSLPIKDEDYFPKFPEQTLFYIFYGMPKDKFQMRAAQELCRRGWFYHKKLRLWFTYVDGSTRTTYPPMDKGPFCVFDIRQWKKVDAENAIVVDQADRMIFESSSQ